MSDSVPQSWQLVELSEIAETSSGGTPSRTNPENYSGEIPWIKSGNLNDGTVSQADEFITELALKNSAAKMFPAGTLLIALYGATIGKLGMLAMAATTNQAICGIFLSENVSKEFLFSFLLSQRRALIKLGQGGAQPNISQQIIRGIQVPLPPLNEQKRIVAKIEELFSELDAGEESLRKARRQLGVYRQSLLKQAFEGKLTAAWREQNPQLLGKPLVATTKLDAEPGPLPPGWIWQTLCEVANVSGGLTKNSKRDSLSLRIPYLRVANVYANELRLAEIKDIGVTPAEAAKVRLVKGDLLIVEGNGSLDQIGRVAAWNGSIPDCGHQNHLIRARCQPNAHYAFVLMFLLSPHGRDVIEKQAASTSGLHTLSVSKVQRLPVPLCSLPEQQEIVRLLDEQFTVIEQNEREIDTALKRSEALRQSILKKAFSGQLVAQDPADEPAGVLLERIVSGRSGKSGGSVRLAGSVGSVKKKEKK